MKPSEITRFSARLHVDVVERLKMRSAREGMSASRLAERLIDEGLRCEELPGIVFRPGPTGRRAALADGPDVWEIVRDVHAARQAGRADPVATVAGASDLTEAQVRLAVAYHAVYPVEIDIRLAEEQELIERLLASVP